MHISVCVVTYRRPEWLGRLLLSLQNQDTGGAFTYSVVVVDNDRLASARSLVESLARISRVPISYVTEPRENLALARNTAIRSGSGPLLAFIDDDEFPGERWLLNLYDAWRTHGVTGVLGPVVPHFEHDPPSWIAKSKICERPRHQTGDVLTWKETRTGNVLLERPALQSESSLFDPRFVIDGEDTDFFKRLIANGHRFIWCDAAVVYETQPASRLRRRYHLRRALLRGSVSYTHMSSKPLGILTSLAAITVYVTALPLLQLSGHHRFMKYCIKTCDHVARLLAACGYRLEDRVKGR
jgi:succinoglycan biosynthesis protein ExoM